MSIQNQLLVTIPHSGEKVPDQCPWLKSLPEPILFCDVDRYVDVLYAPALKELHLPSVKTDWHRYAGDLNRLPEDVDAGTVEASENPAGKFSRGFHWQHTTLKQVLMPTPMSQKTHEELVELIYNPFHQEIQNQIKSLKSRGAQIVYHLDVHSMPSVGTSEHRDPGQERADVVVSDSSGRSSSSEFVDLVIAAYVRAGFRVAYNWPYLGGRVTENYGRPNQQHHCVQVELKRSLYMNEADKSLLKKVAGVQAKLLQALQYICQKSL